MLNRFAMLIVSTVLLVYASAVGVLYFSQRSLLYFPDPTFHSAATLGVDGFRDVRIRTADGETIVGLHKPADPGRPSVLYLHGNAGRMPHLVERMRRLGGDGRGVLVVAYRGFSGSTGSPTEEGLAEDARAAFDFLESEGGDRIVLYGESLGTGVAVRLATERRIAGLVLDAPFTSTAAVAASLYPWAPVSTLMKDRFPSDERIGRVSAPLLVIHGDADGVVPFRFGEALFRLAPGTKRFVRIPGNGHAGNLEAAWSDVSAFIEAAAKGF